MDQLKICGNKPNCVCSLDSREEFNINPIITKLDLEEIERRILSLPRVKLVEKENNYLHFVFISLIFRFKDDLEIYLGDSGKLHIRSSSRVGYSDLGVNRNRVESLRKLL